MIYKRINLCAMNNNSKETTLKLIISYLYYGNYMPCLSFLFKRVNYLLIDHSTIFAYFFFYKK